MFDRPSNSFENIRVEWIHILRKALMHHTTGIVAGLLAAFFQSLSYVATRHFVQRRKPGASRMLLIHSHVWMGILALMLLPIAWPWDKQFDMRPVWPWIAGSVVFYLLGQVGLMMSLARLEPSRVSPLLGFKIVILAIMTITLPVPESAGSSGGHITPLQWLGAGLCVIAAVSLNFSGKRLSAGAIFSVLFACVAYSISDYCITSLVSAIQKNIRQDPADPNHGYIQAALLGASFTYIGCGAVSAIFIPRFGSRTRRDWIGAIPFSLAWFAGMLSLYICFGLLNALDGNVLQSTRGLMSVFMSALLVRAGWLHLEPAVGRHVFARRVFSAALMFLAVYLYIRGNPRYDKMETRPTPTTIESRLP
jgi:hypothetical protein